MDELDVALGHPTVDALAHPVDADGDSDYYGKRHHSVYLVGEISLHSQMADHHVIEPLYYGSHIVSF